MAIRKSGHEETLVDIWLTAHNAEPGLLKSALRKIKAQVEQAVPDLDERVELEPEELRTNGFITDAMRYAAGRVDKRKERKRQERVAVKTARARAGG